MSALLLGLLGAVNVPPASGATATEQNEEFDIWCWVNSARLERGLVPLPMGTLLRNNVARPWSSTIASRGALVHRSSTDLLRSTQAAVAGTDYAGENIGYAQNARQLFDTWMGSTVHRNNILSSRWEYIGVGMTSPSRRWGVQNFASTNRTDITTVYPTGQRFIDVCDSNVFFNDINWMYDQGISTGTVYPRYKIFRSLTTTSRSAMAAFIYRAVTPGNGTDAPPCTTIPYPYSDVGRNPFSDEICWMYQQGINDGPAGPTAPRATFLPDQVVSRARMADWLFRASDRDCDAGETAPEDCYEPPRTATFYDVPTTHPQFAAIEWASAAGVTNGYEDGSFQPGGSITRQAIAAMLHRYVD
jgi:hypothetical protein